MNKTLSFSLSLLLAAMLLMSCNKNTPKDVAQTWLTGFNQMEFDEPMKVSTNETKNMLASLQQLTDKVADSAKKELKKVKVSIKDVKVTGDNAVATYTTSDNPGVQTLNLVKQNDKWLVQFTKSDLTGITPGAQDVAAPPADTTAPAMPDTTHVAVPK